MREIGISIAIGATAGDVTNSSRIAHRSAAGLSAGVLLALVAARIAG